MLIQSQMPIFKKDDLVKSIVTLPVARMELTKDSPVFPHPTDSRRSYVDLIPINSAPVQGLLIKPGVVFEIDTVLPWGDLEDKSDKRYRLALKTYYLSVLDEAEHQITEAEFASLNLILDENNQELPFYVYADEEEVVLCSAVDGRTPKEPVVDIWPADENFPWTVRMRFPTADEVLRYDIQAWFYADDTDVENSDDYVECFGLWLRPLYVCESQSKVILSLQAHPGKWLDLEQPFISFQSAREAQCILNTEAQIIDIILRSSIAIDLGQQRWQFTDDGDGINWREESDSRCTLDCDLLTRNSRCVVL